MATIIECLRELPEDMLLIDLSATELVKRTVSELMRTLPEHHANERGYEVRRRKINYGKTDTVSIGEIRGPNLYNQAH